MKSLAIVSVLIAIVIVSRSQDIAIDVGNDAHSVSRNGTLNSDIRNDLEGNINGNNSSERVEQNTGSIWVEGPIKNKFDEKYDHVIPNDTKIAQHVINETVANQNVTDADNATNKRVVCLKANVTNSTDKGLPEPFVLMLNNTEFQARLLEEYNSNVTNRSGAASCSLTLFFAPWCPFSASAAPHFNALARVFPDFRLYAVDSSLHHSLNTQFGIMALPTILIFHNSRPLYKYNYTEYSLTKYAEFITILTGIEPVNVTLEPTEQDFLGPVPTEAVVGVNYYLWLACIFSLLYGLVQFSKSPVCERMVDTIRNLWREAEIQHEHAE